MKVWYCPSYIAVRSLLIGQLFAVRSLLIGQLFKKNTFMCSDCSAIYCNMSSFSCLLIG